MNVVEKDAQEYQDETGLIVEENWDTILVEDRLSLYYQVVKALVPGHNITDDDPERAVVEALDHIQIRATPNRLEDTDLRERTEELVGEVRSDGD